MKMEIKVALAEAKAWRKYQKLKRAANAKAKADREKDFEEYKRRLERNRALDAELVAKFGEDVCLHSCVCHQNHNVLAAKEDGKNVTLSKPLCKVKPGEKCIYPCAHKVVKPWQAPNYAAARARERNLVKR